MADHTRLTDEEQEKLTEVLQIVDEQMQEGYCEYAECDENFIYLDGMYDDGTVEEMKLRRGELNSDKSIQEIADSVW